MRCVDLMETVLIRTSTPLTKYADGPYRSAKEDRLVSVAEIDRGGLSPGPKSGGESAASVGVSTSQPDIGGTSDPVT